MTHVLDIVAVPADGDPLTAVRNVSVPARLQEDLCDVLVVGGGTGGVAAAIAAVRWGATVCVLEEASWIGGQLTAQGVSALDEHPLIEHAGGTRTYYRLREKIRAHYRARSHRLAADAEANPGNCWVSRLAFEPQVAASILEQMLREAARGARATIHTRRKAIMAEVTGSRIDSIISVGLDSGIFLRHRFRYVIDATDLGDVLPMAGLEFVVGAESRLETGEPHAQPGEPLTDSVQSFTYPAVVTRNRGRYRAARRTPPAPRGYQQNRAQQPYSLKIHVTGGEIYGDETGWMQYSVYETLPGTKGGLWSYRRLLDAGLLPELRDDISILNWPGNDYRRGNLLDRPPAEQAVSLQEAKLVSLGFVHWLRTEAPISDVKQGHPEIVLKPDVYGTSDGLSMMPYVRESRRIKALVTIREQDVATDYQSGPRAVHYRDSVGLGWYPIDIHSSHPRDLGVSTRTHPFQIPAGALVPRQATNLLAGAKNIGTTHITNGCYRLHPVEWNIGESAGALAAFAIATEREPVQIAQDPALLARFQVGLIEAGVPLYWYADIHPNNPGFRALQLATLQGRVDGAGSLHACRLNPEDRRDLGLSATCNAPELLAVVP